jgi:RNA polymerase sigma factor (sigma-70 family)
MSEETNRRQYIGGLRTEYKGYERQKCFIGHSREAEWRADILSACADVLPRFGLEPWYAADHFDPTKPLRDKVVELIANARYGIYDLSSWQDTDGEWHLPRNVFIELGMAIVLNRPSLLLRYSTNKILPLPACLQGVELVGFAGDKTLKGELEARLPQWLGIPPDRDWLNRFCIFGNRVCDFRQTHPGARQWGQETLHCHIADGLDEDSPNFLMAERDEIRGAFENILCRYTDLEFGYLNQLPLIEGYDFALCGHCLAIRSAPFAIYRILPHTPTEVFIAIGMSIALEALFEYDIPKVLLVRQEQDLPSLLRGYEVVEAANSSEVKKKLKKFIPKVMQKIQETAYKPRPLPFVETAVFADKPQPLAVTSTHPHVLIVDDDAGARQRLIGLLQMIGYQTAEAETNAQALDLLSNPSASFSLVSTDALRRPERAGEAGYVGLDLVKEINQRFPEVPTILVSRDDPAFLKKRAPGLHVKGVLGKGLSDEETTAAIQRVLAGETLPNPWQTQSAQEQERTPQVNDIRYSLLAFLVDLESALRGLVERALQSSYGQEWPEQLNVRQRPDRLSLGMLLRLVEKEREIFEPLFTTPQAYGTLVTTAREITETRNALAHGLAGPDAPEMERVQQLVERLLPAVRDAQQMAEDATPERRFASRDDRDRLSPEESLLSRIFGETHRSGKSSLDAEKHKELTKLIQDCFRELSPREARILQLRFGLINGRNYTLEEVGQKFGLTGERIRQIEATALAKLRHPTIARRLREYVDYLIPESESSERQFSASRGSRMLVATFSLLSVLI